LAKLNFFVQCSTSFVIQVNIINFRR